jgi:hypothetical protein
MKKIIFLVLLCHLSLFAQQKSGTTYSSHPALDAINAMNKAFVEGDLKAYETFFSPDVKIYSIGETKSTDLKRDLENSEWWVKNYDLTITRSEGVRPDVIQYEDNKKGVWVMDWTNFLAVHKISGDTVKTWFHDEYFINTDNKITTWLTYYNLEDLGAQIQNSFGAHRNGRVYDEHPIIESVEALVAAWVAGDPEKMATHFAADAKFYRLGEGDGFKGITLDEMKAKWTAGVSSTRERNMTVYGYPDAIYYEKGEGGWQVHSWWNYTNVDAKTGKESKGFVHMNHSFNADRKISSELIWFD